MSATAATTRLARVDTIPSFLDGLRGAGPDQPLTLPRPPVARGARGREEEAVDAQQLAEGPGLERAAAGRVGRVAVGNLRDVAETRRVQVREQRSEESV